MNPYLEELRIEWSEQGHRVEWAHDHRDLSEAESVFETSLETEARPLCFCLGYDRILPRSLRNRCAHTLVAHESDLPQGKGWSPLTWQILEGRSEIPVTLFEAEDGVDSGPIYAQRWMHFDGHELIDELRAAQAAATHELCRWFVDEYPENARCPRPQSGEESFYPRRTPADSRLEPDKTLAEQIDQLRVVDNQRYPAFFEWLDYDYRLIVTRCEPIFK